MRKLSERILMTAQSENFAIYLALRGNRLHKSGSAPDCRPALEPMSRPYLCALLVEPERGRRSMLVVVPDRGAEVLIG